MWSTSPGPPRPRLRPRVERGTAKAIADAGIPVTDTAELTGFPAILGHRVVTLHPEVHGGILADPTDAAHRADMADHGIEAFDLVVINAYPFGTDPADFEHGGTAGAWTCSTSAGRP